MQRFLGPNSILEEDDRRVFADDGFEDVGEGGTGIEKGFVGAYDWLARIRQQGEKGRGGKKRERGLTVGEVCSGSCRFFACSID